MEPLAQSSKPIRAHLDEIIVPYEQAEMLYAQLLERMPQQVLEALIVAWHHDHLRHQCQPSPSVTITLNDNTGSRSPMGSLTMTLLPLQTVVFGQLDLIIRASSLVEMVNAFIRPSLKSCKRADLPKRRSI